MNTTSNTCQSPDAIARDRIRNAAPDLLAALEGLRDSDEWERCDDPDCRICPKRDVALAAIAKARGVEDR